MQDLYDQFKKDVVKYDEDFLRDLMIMKRRGAPSTVWRQVRDGLLPSYPLLERCYREHDLQKGIPVDKQGNEARLGRQLAASMYNIRRAVYEETVPRRVAQPLICAESAKCYYNRSILCRLLKFLNGD